MIAAGVNAKALSTYMGHSSITITIDRYGHLMPGNEKKPLACSTPTSVGRWNRSGEHPGYEEGWSTGTQAGTQSPGSP
jgi:hypothetical protein